MKTEIAIITAILGLLIAVAVTGGKRIDAFKEACAQMGGTPLFDGRQYQCIKK